MPITLDGTLGVGTPGITLAGGAITANANQLNSSAEDVNSENRIINGDFRVWQRGGSTSANAFAADRWSNGLLGGAVTHSIQAFPVGETLGANSPPYFLRQTVSGQTLSSSFAVTLQKIEGVRAYAGQTVTILGWARRSSGTGNLAFEGIQSFGTTLGSPTGISPGIFGIAPTTVTLGATWAPFAIVVTFPSITGKTLGTDGNDWTGIQFFTSAGSDYNARTNSLGLQTIGVDFWGIHIRVGTWAAADTALYRNRDVGTEVVLCQRYFQLARVAIQSPVGGLMLVPWFTRESMRAAPILTINSAGTSSGASGIVDIVNDNNGGYFQFTATASGAYVINRIYNLDAEL